MEYLVLAVSGQETTPATSLGWKLNGQANLRYVKLSVITVSKCRKIAIKVWSNFQHLSISLC
jgi:hypothetical protein